MLDDVDLSLLTEKLYPEHLVQEPDTVWSWETLFTQVASEINSESQAKAEESRSWYKCICCYYYMAERLLFRNKYLAKVLMSLFL